MSHKLDIPIDNKLYYIDEELALTYKDCGFFYIWKNGQPTKLHNVTFSFHSPLLPVYRDDHLLVLGTNICGIIVIDINKLSVYELNAYNTYTILGFKNGVIHLLTFSHGLTMCTLKFIKDHYELDTKPFKRFEVPANLLAVVMDSDYNLLTCSEKQGTDIVVNRITTTDKPELITTYGNGDGNSWIKHYNSSYHISDGGITGELIMTDVFTGVQYSLPPVISTPKDISKIRLICEGKIIYMHEDSYYVYLNHHKSARTAEF